MEEIASALVDMGFTVSHGRAVYLSLTGATVDHERLLALSPDRRVKLVLVLAGDEVFDARISIWGRLPKGLVEELEDLGALIDDSDAPPYRLVVRGDREVLERLIGLLGNLLG